MLQTGVKMDREIKIDSSWICVALGRFVAFATVVRGGFTLHFVCDSVQCNSAGLSFHRLLCSFKSKFQGAKRDLLDFTLTFQISVAELFFVSRSAPNVIRKVVRALRLGVIDR